MAKEISFGIGLALNDRKFRSGLKTDERRFKRFSSGIRKQADLIKKSFGSVTSVVAGLGVTIGVTSTLIKSAKLDQSLTRIGQTASVAKAQTESLRTNLFRMSAETGESLQSLKDGFDSLVQSGLSFKEALATIEAINPAMAVTGSRAEVLAAGLTSAAESFNFDLSNVATSKTLLDQMTQAGRLGNAELEDLSSIFARLGGNAKDAGLGFTQTLAFIEQLSKVEKQNERLATLADSTLRLFTNLKLAKKVSKETKIQFFDKAGARRDAIDVLGDIKQQFDKLGTDLQRANFIDRVLPQADLDTKKGFRKLLDTDNLNNIREMSGRIESAGGTIKKDLSTALNNAVSQSGRLKATLGSASVARALAVNGNQEAKIVLEIRNPDGGQSLVKNVTSKNTKLDVRTRGRMMDGAG